MPKIDPKRWYTAREAGGFLDVTAETIKNYCKKKTMAGRRVGPKSEWRVQGSQIVSKARKWGLDPAGLQS